MADKNGLNECNQDFNNTPGNMKEDEQSDSDDMLLVINEMCFEDDAEEETLEENSLSDADDLEMERILTEFNAEEEQEEEIKSSDEEDDMDSILQEIAEEEKHFEVKAENSQASLEGDEEMESILEAFVEEGEDKGLEETRLFRKVKEEPKTYYPDEVILKCEQNVAGSEYQKRKYDPEDIIEDSTKKYKCHYPEAEIDEIKPSANLHCTTNQREDTREEASIHIKRKGGLANLKKIVKTVFQVLNEDKVAKLKDELKEKQEAYQKLCDKLDMYRAKARLLVAQRELFSALNDHAGAGYGRFTSFVKAIYQIVKLDTEAAHQEELKERQMAYQDLCNKLNLYKAKVSFYENFIQQNGISHILVDQKPDFT